MNIVHLRRNLSHGMVAIVVAGSVFLASCGGGGSSGGSSQSAGVGGTGIAAGKTTGFGSIYVNGRRFNTATSQFIIDGDPGNQGDLSVGMFVLLKVKTLDGNFTDEALEVVYDDEVQGPVAGILPATCPCPGETQRTFTVFGQNITIDETSTIYDGTTFADLINGRLVEISGFRTSANDITATYVEDKGAISVGSEVELRGTVSGYVPPVPGPESFVIDGITITIDGMTEKFLESGPLQDGMFVEVEGLYQSATVVLAREIEEEDEDFGDDVDDVSLQGVISNYDQITGEFDIDGLPIDTSQATELSPANVLDLLDDGVEIEVEGDIEGGVLIADEVELREGQTELRTTVSDIELPNRFQVEYPTLGMVWINTDGQTLFEDEDDSGGKTPVENFSIDLLALGDFVKVKGITESGEVTAQIVKRLDPNDSSKLQGAVEAFVRTVPASITILGVEYPIDAFADYEDAAGSTLTKDQFFDQLEVTPNAVVELEDDEPDADADEVEFDD